jgi:ribosomal protein S27E
MELVPMTIEFHCGDCNRLLRTSDERSGQRATCPDCGASVVVPGGGGAGGFGGDDFEPDDADARAGGVKYKSCPMCGERIRDVAVKCRHCGEYISEPTAATRPRGASHLAPHRGGMILAFGILSWMVCIIFGPIAWVMGNTDLAEMDAGRMDPEGRSLTQAGKILGMVHCIVLMVALAIVFLFLLVGLAAAAF